LTLNLGFGREPQSPKWENQMSKETWTKVDRYLADLLVGSDPVLNAALEDSEKAGLPPIHVSPNQGKLLMLLAQSIGARRILEIGTLAGYSTIWLARALPAGGRLISIESERKHAEVAQSNIARAGLAGVVEIRVGLALVLLPRIAAESREPFDLIFIDADKQSYPGYFAWALKMSHRGTMIVVDNVVRDGDVIYEDSPNVSVPGVRRMLELVAAEPRVSATAIQTVCSKGHDGFLLARVIADA
jgi:predicted O-methyltransferase YrrM